VAFTAGDVLPHQLGQRRAGQALVGTQRHARQRQRLQTERERFDRRRLDARRAQRSNQRTGRCADDEIRREPHLVQRAQHTHMREAARPAGAEHPSDARRARQRLRAWGVVAVVVGVGAEGAGAEGGAAGRGQQQRAPAGTVALSAAVGRGRR
jgi:hypothetical protein